jgi:energy-converting hydrogenase A subunit M
MKEKIYLRCLKKSKKNISERRNKYYKDDLILTLKRQSNLSIREVPKILSINRDMVAGIKV